MSKSTPGTREFVMKPEHLDFTSASTHVITNRNRYGLNGHPWRIPVFCVLSEDAPYSSSTKKFGDWYRALTVVTKCVNNRSLVKESNSLQCCTRSKAFSQSIRAIWSSAPFCSDQSCNLHIIYVACAVYPNTVSPTTCCQLLSVFYHELKKQISCK